MMIRILNCVGLFILILSGLKLALYLQHSFASLKIKKSKSINIQKNYRKLLVVFVIFIVICVIIVFLVKGLIFPLASDSYNENKTIEKEHTSSYKEAIGKIPFHDEVINEEQIIWEHLFSNELMYDKFQNWSNETSEFDKLRKLYQKDFCSMGELPNINLDELSKHINSYYGSEILPATDKSLEEVEKQIPPLAERQNADVELFQNEFYLRAKNCKENSSSQYLYQVSRAADDAFKILSRKQGASLKKMIFYGSMSVAFSLASIKNYDGNIELVYAYYRIAEVYLYLEKYVDTINKNLEYSQHCLLMAERFLMLAQDEYKKKNDNTDILAKLPYFSCYYAEILDKYIARYSKNKELVSMCNEYANDYLDSPYPKKNADCCKSCRDILERLEKLE